MSTNKNPGKIITFYSFKGGTGRSMALANVAWILASDGKKVLVLDWDLDAPGVYRYFRPFLAGEGFASSRGIIDFILDFAAQVMTPLDEGETLSKDWYKLQANILNYAIPLKYDFPAGGRLDFVSAGKPGLEYVANFASFNWQNFYDLMRIVSSLSGGNN